MVKQVYGQDTGRTMRREHMQLVVPPVDLRQVTLPGKLDVDAAV
jgi:hypothetical protein